MLALLAGGSLVVTTVNGAAFNQIDTFEAGTLLGWGNGLPAPDPVVVATGGPLGVNDHFLRLSADGSFTGGKLTVFNQSQWSGNFLGAGISVIEMDLLNLSASPLSIHIALKTGGGQAPGYYSTIGFSLLNDSLWHHAVFNLSTSDLSPAGGVGALNTLLAGVGEMRIYHGNTPLSGDAFVGQLGIDNILAVPEPNSWMLFLTGLLGLYVCVRLRSLPS